MPLIAARHRIVEAASSAFILGLVAAGCGGDGGGGQSVIEEVRNTRSSAIQGYVSNGPNGDVSGITVAAVAGSAFTASTTGPLGGFSFADAPVGDVTVEFSRGAGCAASIPFADVSNSSSLNIRNIAFNCRSAVAGPITESFRGVLENAPGAHVAVLSVCTPIGTGEKTRTVKTDTETQYADRDGQAIDFTNFVPGDVVEVSGFRENVGAPSTVVAGTVQQLASGVAAACGG
jgi:hypothetical protein